MLPRDVLEPCVVLPQHVLAIVVAVRRTNDGMDVLTDRLGAVECDARLMVQGRHVVSALREPDTSAYSLENVATGDLVIYLYDDEGGLQDSSVADGSAPAASHELRAPLTAVQGDLELLERHPDLPADERQEALREASHKLRRLVRLVNDLLTLARADLGLAPRRERVALDELLMAVFIETRSLAGGRRFDVAGLEAVVVRGDPDWLRQLLLILVDNALKYTPPDGSVLLALRREGDAALVTVRDTGVGIAPDDLPRVFERFFRADPARTRTPDGAGLGLAIARWIVQQHGGTIELESALGQGTTATVRLPTTE